MLVLRSLIKYSVVTLVKKEGKKLNGFLFISRLEICHQDYVNFFIAKLK